MIFFFQAEDGIRDLIVTGVQTCALPIYSTRLAEKARAAAVGVELKIWPVVPHVWQLAPDKIPEARQSLRESAEFLRRRSEERRVGKECGCVGRQCVECN